MTEIEILPLLDEFNRYCQIDRNADAATTQKHIYHLKVLLRTYGEFTEEVGRTHLIKLKQTHKPNSIARWLYAMRILCDFLVLKGLLTENWARKIPQPKIPRTVPHIPSTEELEKIIAAHSDRTFMYYSDPEPAKYLWDSLYLFLAETGCRLGEMLNAKCGDFYYDGDYLLWTLNETKTRKGRTVPIARSLSERIRRYLNFNTPQRQLFIHPLTKKPFREHQVETQFRLRKRICCINKPYVVHSLRKYFIVELLRADVSVLKVMELVGHENLSTTQGYARMVLDDLKEAVKRLPMEIKNRPVEEIIKDIKTSVEKRGISTDPRFEITSTPDSFSVKAKKISKGS